MIILELLAGALLLAFLIWAAFYWASTSMWDEEDNL